MPFQFSKHVLVEMEARAIPASIVQAVLNKPEQKVPEIGDVVCYQSRVRINDKPYLVRVMVNEGLTPPKVVTVYRTSKIRKYWQ